MHEGLHGPIMGNEIAQMNRQGDHPLANGDFWYHVVNQVRCNKGRPMAKAAWAEAPLPAGERYEMGKAAAQAAAQDETSRKDSAIQIGTKLFEHMNRQTSFVLVQSVDKGLEMGADEVIQHA
jgi:hypothetical protein